MNELDVLRRWSPRDLDIRAFDHEATARVALRRAVEGGSATVRPARHRLAGRALVATAVTLALVVGAVVVATRRLDERIDHVRRVHVGGLQRDGAAGLPTTVLVVGTDSRAFVRDQAQADAFGTPAQEGGQRSDTMILLRIDRSGADAVWLPRDLVVDDGSGATRQLNGYLDAGPAALVDAVRRVTGAPIEHYVQVDFAGFVHVVDTVGAVRLWVPRPVRDRYTGLDLPGAGCTSFDGDTALAWVRSRHLEERDGDTWVDISPHADLDRIARQQEMLTAIATRTRARLGDPTAADRVAERVLASLTVDAGMSRDDVKLLAGRLLDPGRLRTATAPNLADPVELGRLRLVERPPGSDFVSWAVGTTAGDAVTTPGPVGSATDPGPPPRLGQAC